jgi:DNA-binding FadR family transcriptional regulator
MAEQVAAVLRERILAAEIGDGSLLPKQDDLVGEFGVSYPSVREALRILETEGLITIRRGSAGGAEVHAPGASTAGYALGLALQATRVRVSDLGEALASFEPGSAAHCAGRADRADSVVPVLRRLVEISEEHLSDDVAFTQVSREFHDALVSLNDNATERLVLRSLASIWSVQEETWAAAMSRAGEYPTLEERHRVLHAHRRIVDAIESGDGRKAERVSRAHIEATQLYMVPKMQDEIVDASSPAAQAHYRVLGKLR